MARALWKGSISFGLVNIPIELHTAVRNHRPKFRMLHAKDKSPVHYNRVCEREGKAVAWDDLVKGYEYSKGHYVVLTKDDFRTAAVEKTKTIDILDFVQAGEIDDRYFENSYYALAGTGGDRAYAVLREALRKSGRVGIGKLVLRDTQHLAELSVVDDALVLTMMRFQNELVDTSKFRFPAAKMVRDRELSMAEKLIDNLATDWDPTQYKDDYRANLMRVIHAKVEGKEVHLKAEETPQDAHVVDLMERLKQSLEGRGRKSARPTRRKRAGKRRAA